MRTGVRCVLAVIGAAASVVVTPAGVSLAASSQSHGIAIASILPARDEVVGVAHPVMVRFTAAVANRQAAERSVEVKSTPAMTGKFDWLDNNVVQWVPDRYWPAHSTIALTVGGVSTEIKTGPAVVGVANDTVELAEPVPVGLNRHRDGVEHSFQVSGVDGHGISLFRQPARNIAQSQGWSSMVCNSPSRCISVTEAPAISSDVQ